MMNLRPPKYRVSKKSLFLTAIPLAGFGAIVINSLLYFLGSFAEIINPIQLPNKESLHVMYVILYSLVPSVLFGLFLFLLSRILKKEAWRIFRAFCILLACLTLLIPFLSLGKITFGMAVLFTIMQGVCLGSILIFFRWKGVVLAP